MYNSLDKYANLWQKGQQDQGSKVISGIIPPKYHLGSSFIELFSHKRSHLSPVFSVCAGCRGAIVVAEARSADEPSLTRRCVIMKVPDFTTDKYLQAQKQHAAAVLILLPRNISSVPFDTIKVASPPQTKPAGREPSHFRGSAHLFAPQNFMLSERDALLKETLMPVYVVPEDEQMLYMYEEVKQAAAMHASSIFIRGERNREDHAEQPHTCV